MGQRQGWDHGCLHKIWLKAYQGIDRIGKLKSFQWRQLWITRIAKTSYLLFISSYSSIHLYRFRFRTNSNLCHVLPDKIDLFRSHRHFEVTLKYDRSPGLDTQAY